MPGGETSARVPELDACGEAGLNIAAVARRTGVAADTLRKWERRYAILRPKRTSGGQRRYDDADIARVEWLRDRLEEGYRIGEAAALLVGTVGGASSTDELTRQLVEAARAVDSGRVSSLVEQAFTVFPVDVAVEQVAAPALRSVGDAWTTGLAAVGEEHLLSHAVRSRLQRLLADRRAGVRGTAVLACAPGESHELGLLALAVLLQADGWLVAYVGADAPVAATASVAARVGADVVCLSASTAATARRLRDDLGDAPFGARRVVLGGPAGPRAAKATTLPPATPLADAVAELRAA